MDWKSSKKLQWFYPLAGLWFLIVLFWPRSSNVVTNRNEAPQSLTQEDLYRSALTNANFGLLGVRFYESLEGKPRWKIESKFAELHRKDNYTFLKTVLANFFSENTQNQIVTKSDYGRAWNEKNYIELEGNVSIESGKGYLFEMNRLNYDGKKHEFSSNDTVQMRGPDLNHPVMFLRGVGLTAQIDKEHFILDQNVSSQKKLKNGQWLKVVSRSGEFYTRNSRALFLGSVRTSFPRLNITSDVFELSSEEGEENAHALGNVVLRDKNRTGYAQKAFLEIGGNEIILEGKARIESDGNIIQGKRIKLYSDEDRIEVDEAEGRNGHETPR
jgi:LPS export ABC transporter protein LptC/lipopolysaccharide transport protein LptA